MRTFDPWIGGRYAGEGIRGVRLLILGESHYSEPKDNRSGFTEDVVREFVQGRRHRFFTVAQRLVSGGRGWPSDTDRKEFWDRVAFYNYIQTCLQATRCRPTPVMWLAAREPFLQTLGGLVPRPQLLLVLGRELRRNLPELPAEIEVCA